MYCKTCGTQIDDDSMFCSNCGTNFNKNSTINQNKIEPFENITVIDSVKAEKTTVNETEPKNDAIKFIGIVLFVVAIIAIIIAVTFDNSGISYSKYTNVQIGMSYSEVVDILGSEGKIVSDNYIDGLGRYICVQWSGDGAIIQIYFVDGYVESKYQTGL